MILFPPSGKAWSCDTKCGGDFKFSEVNWDNSCPPLSRRSSGEIASLGNTQQKWSRGSSQMLFAYFRNHSESWTKCYPAWYRQCRNHRATRLRTANFYPTSPRWFLSALSVKWIYCEWAFREASRTSWSRSDRWFVWFCDTRPRVFRSRQLGPQMDQHSATPSFSDRLVDFHCSSFTDANAAPWWPASCLTWWCL